MVYETPQEYKLRCAFPRGRVLESVEDLLTVLTQSIVKLTPNETDRFKTLFDNEYQKMRDVVPKSIKNFRTEMLTLFGLLNINSGIVTPSSRTKLLVETQNFPFFFKTFCNRFQFPNGMNKPNITTEFLEAGVHFKPAKYLLELFDLGIAEYGSEFYLTGAEVSNLVFNDRRVTTGIRKPADVLDELISLRHNGTSFKSGSNIVQHGREFLGYMFLARLLNEENRCFYLNELERDAINFIKSYKEFFTIPPDFATNPSVRKQILNDWQSWFGDVNQLERDHLTQSRTKYDIEDDLEADVSTKLKTTTKGATPKPIRARLKEIGDKGELVALKYERKRISSIRPDKVALVQKVSNDTSLGYDIQSLEYEILKQQGATEKIFIEVKTTMRTFPPSEEVLTFFRMSANEWNTAKEFGEKYYIYRVFLLRSEPSIFIIKDPSKQEESGDILLEPLQYRVVVKEGAGNYADS